MVFAAGINTASAACAARAIPFVNRCASGHCQRRIFALQRYWLTEAASAGATYNGATTLATGLSDAQF